MDVYIHISLTSASCPSHFTPGTHWIGGWVEPRAGLDDFGEKKILDPTGTRTPTPQSSSQSVSIPTTLSQLPILIHIGYKNLSVNRFTAIFLKLASGLCLRRTMARSSGTVAAATL
jgi:hypothetical protein